MKIQHLLLPLTLIGVIFFIAGAYLCVKQIYFNYHALYTTGTVVEASSRPTLEFTSQNNETIRFAAHTTSHPSPYALGYQLEVLYLPDNPQKAYINSFSDKWFLSLMVIFTGLLFIIPYGYPLIRLLKHDRAQKLLDTNGKKITTTYQKTVVLANDTNDTSYQVYSYWLDPDQPNDMYIYKSDWLKNDPRPLIEQNKVKEITVIVNPKNYASYRMDTSYLEFYSTGI